MTPRNDGLQEGVLPRRHLPQHVQDLPHRRTAQVSLTQGLGLVGGVSPLWLCISEMRLLVNISVHPRSSSPQSSSDQTFCSKKLKWNIKKESGICYVC